MFLYSNPAPTLACCLMITPQCQNCSLETDVLAQCLWQIKFKEITQNTLTLRVLVQLLARRGDITYIPVTCSYSHLQPLVDVPCENTCREHLKIQFQNVTEALCCLCNCTIAITLNLHLNPPLI